MTCEIDVHFNTQGSRGGILVLVAVGTDVYGATALEPHAALRAAARSASDDLTRRGLDVDPSAIVRRGLEALAIRNRSL